MHTIGHATVIYVFLFEVVLGELICDGCDLYTCFSAWILLVWC